MGQYYVTVQPGLEKVKNGMDVHFFASFVLHIHPYFLFPPISFIFLAPSLLLHPLLTLLCRLSSIHLHPYSLFFFQLSADLLIDPKSVSSVPSFPSPAGPSAVLLLGRGWADFQGSLGGGSGRAQSHVVRRGTGPVRPGPGGAAQGFVRHPAAGLEGRATTVRTAFYLYSRNRNSPGKGLGSAARGGTTASKLQALDNWLPGTTTTFCISVSEPWVCKHQLTSVGLLKAAAATPHSALHLSGLFSID